jgi:hypothetical protein
MQFLPRPTLLFCIGAVWLACVAKGGAAPAAPPADPSPLVQSYVNAVRKLNEEHARRPGKTNEDALKAKLPRAAAASLEKLLGLDASPAVLDGLSECAGAALDLDRTEDFDKIRRRLEATAPDRAKALGTTLSRPRFQLRGLRGLDARYLETFADVMDTVLAAYDDVFGFKEWSKVPGKKLRVRIHLESKIEKPPHFAPELPFHSEIDFPVVDPEVFRSPTADGKFLFYGLCHELGHVIAMWGDARREEDHHTWAHYTGVTIVEHLAAKQPAPACLAQVKDRAWRSLEGERKRLSGHAPGLEDADATLALFIQIHDRVGPGAVGSAINHLDALDQRKRIGRVRYYTFDELRAGLLATVKDKKAKQAIVDLFAQAKTKPGQ